MTTRIEVHDDADQLATAVAGELLARLVAVQAGGAVPQICLTGGTIARKIHAEAARLSAGSDVDWSRVDVFFGDERFVAPDSEDRNAAQARSDLLDPVGATRVFEIGSTADAATAEEAADAYAATVRAEGRGSFDIVMLGLGPDGHIASLFPGFGQVHVDDAIAVAVHDSPKPPPDRVSLTVPALRRTREVWFLVSGEEKAGAVARAQAPEGSVDETPARALAVVPDGPGSETGSEADAESGAEVGYDVTWWLDTASASQL